MSVRPHPSSRHQLPPRGAGGGGGGPHPHPQPRPHHRKPPPRPRSRPRLHLPVSPQPPPQQQQQGSSIPSPKVHWAPGLLRLEDLLQDYPLPQLVRCRTQGLRTREGERPLALPLEDHCILLAEQRSARHLLARIVLHDAKTGAFHESVDSVVIPEDYEGHFLRLQSRTTKDKTNVKSLETIARDDTPAFLNLANITSFPAHPRDPGDQSRFIYTVGNVFLVDEPWPPTEPKDTQSDEDTIGNVQQTLSAVSDSSRNKSVRSSTSGRSTNGVMKCLDERGMAILVPTNQVGEMVMVEGQGSGCPKLSVQSRDLMGGQQFPLLTRYAYGRRPPRLHAFSKLLTLLDSFQETSVIACLLNPASLTLLEIPLTSSLSFQPASNFPDLLPRVPRLRRALEVCRERGRELCRDIKFKYKFCHRVQENKVRVTKVKDDDDDLPSATVRSRLVVTDTYVYI